MAGKFDGKVAFVTGGTGALGRSVTEAFYSEGASVAVTYIIENELQSFPSRLRDDPLRVLLIKADVTKEDEVDKAFGRATESFKTVDFLVNIVGGYMPKTPIADLQVRDWDHMMDINLKSVYLCSRSALKIMQKKGSGRILNVSAMAGLEPSAGRGAYGVAKSGVATLTRIIADEVKGTGITANAIAPSILVTEANVRSSPGEDYSKWVRPKEIAELMIHLCSEAGRSINGAVIKVYGGL
jgi:NAD(P)-dependent dehydrogenase (short-subunit alcohol dehydrogenase family)